MWGYLDTADPLNTWGADHAVEHPDELVALLGGALAERARELQKRADERLSESEREMRYLGRQ